MDELEKLFCGTWKHESDENFKEAITASKMPKEDVEFLSTTKPTMTITRQGDQICYSTELMKGAVHDVTFELGKEFEAKDEKFDPPLYHNKIVCKFQNGKLIYETRSQLTGPRKLDFVTVMSIKDGKLISDLSPLCDRSIVGRRIFMKA